MKYFKFVACFLLFFQVNAAFAYPQFISSESDFIENVINWSAQVAVASTTYKNADIKTKLDNLEQYFTPKGFDSYKNALTESGTIDSLKSNDHFRESFLRAEPEIIAKKKQDNHTVWIVEHAIQVKYINPSRVDNKQNIILKIMQPHDKNLPVGVEQLIVYDDDIKEQIRELSIKND